MVTSPVIKQMAAASEMHALGACMQEDCSVLHPTRVASSGRQVLVVNQEDMDVPSSSNTSSI
jgi:hypothetical protein